MEETINLRLEESFEVLKCCRKYSIFDNLIDKRSIIIGIIIYNGNSYCFSQQEKMYNKEELITAMEAYSNITKNDEKYKEKSSDEAKYCTFRHESTYGHYKDDFYITDSAIKFLLAIENKDYNYKGLFKERRVYCEIYLKMISYCLANQDEDYLMFKNLLNQVL